MTRKERRFKGVANASEQSLPLCRSTMCGKVVGPRLQLECGEGLPQRTQCPIAKNESRRCDHRNAELHQLLACRGHRLE
jgi:hypothetical protein